MKITECTLRALGACKDGMNAFHRRFGADLRESDLLGTKLDGAVS